MANPDVSLASLKPEVKSSVQFHTHNGEDVTRFSSIPLCLIGFGVLLGWHFMVLYSPFSLMESVLALHLFLRQIILNGSLALSFILFGFVLNHIEIKDSQLMMRLFLPGAAIATCGCLGLILFSNIESLTFFCISLMLMGFGEAMITLGWLRFYTDVSLERSGRYLALSAVLGSVLCFFARYLTVELSLLVFVIMPATSAVLFSLAQGMKMREEEEVGVGIPDWKQAKKPFIMSTMQLVVFAFVFGFFQGSVATGGNALVSFDATFSILGVAVAGLIVVLMYLNSPVRPDLSVIYRVSIFLLIMGFLSAPFAVSTSWLNIISSVMSMTGFIMLELIVTVFVIDLIRTFDMKASLTVGIFKASEYGAFAVGIIFGYILWGVWGDSVLYGFGVSTVAALLASAASLFLVSNTRVWSAEFYVPETTFEKPAEETPEDSVHSYGRWRAACDKVCEDYGLSPREKEIFLYVAKGRNAEYIQNALFISCHTAKTHISNIYRKLEVHSSQALLDIVEQEKEQMKDVF